MLNELTILTQVVVERVWVFVFSCTFLLLVDYRLWVAVLFFGNERILAFVFAIENLNFS